MAASITVYQSFAEYIADGTIDMDTDTFKVSLHTSAYTPSASSHTVYANLTNELSTANGYTNGGATLASVTWNRSGGTVTFDAADVVWTASGGSIAARYAVIRKDGTANAIVSPLVAYILLDTTPADVTATAGNTFTLQWNASGIFTLAIA
jgi:hypothetical protein